MEIIKNCPMCGRDLQTSKKPNTLMGLTKNKTVCYECFIENSDLWDYENDCMISQQDQSSSNDDLLESLEKVVNELEQSQELKSDPVGPAVSQLENSKMVELKDKPFKQLEPKQEKQLDNPLPLSKILKDVLKDLKKFLTSEKGLQAQKANITKSDDCKTITRLEFTNHFNTEYSVYDSEEQADQNGVFFNDLLRQGVQVEQDTNHVYGQGKSHKPLTQRINTMKDDINKAMNTRDERIQAINEYLAEQELQAQSQATPNPQDTKPEPTKGE